MNDPELFGHPTTGLPDLWPPKATPTSILGKLEAPQRRGISYDWKFFTVAAIVVVIAVILAFAAMSLAH